MDKIGNVKVSVVEKPARKVLVKRGVKAGDYMAYCEEVGCEIWDQLVAMPSLCGEPVCLWLPEELRAGGSEYVQGVEAEADYSGEVPEGFDTVDLPAATYLLFHGEPYDDAVYEDAISEVNAAMEAYDPARLGFVWDPANPTIQLEPRGERGYMALRAVKRE